MLATPLVKQDNYLSTDEKTKLSIPLEQEHRYPTSTNQEWNKCVKECN